MNIDLIVVKRRRHDLKSLAMVAAGEVMIFQQMQQSV